MIAIIRESEKDRSYKPNYTIREDLQQKSEQEFNKAKKIIEGSESYEILKHYGEIEEYALLKKDSTEDGKESFVYFCYIKDAPIEIVFDDDITKILKITIFPKGLVLAKEGVQNRLIEKLRLVANYYKALIALPDKDTILKAEIANEKNYEIAVDDTKKRAILNILSFTLEKLKEIFGIEACFVKQELLGYITIVASTLNMQKSDEEQLRELFAPKKVGLLSSFLKRFKNDKYDYVQIPTESGYFLIFDSKLKLKDEESAIFEMMLSHLGALLALHKKSF